jgi:uncharacterized protein (TIGR03084 family)
MRAAISVAGLCDDLAAEHAVLDCMVSGLDDEGWALATPAEPWSIRDQVAHLAYFDERAIIAVTDHEAFIAHVAGIDLESRLDRHLDLGGREGPGVLAHWRVVRTELLSLLRRLDAADRLPWYGPPMSAASFITARLMETWAHGQDVADALGVHRQATPRLAHIAHLGVRTFAWSHQVRGLPVPEAAPRVELRLGDAEIYEWNDGGDGLVSGPIEDFCLVVTQRRHVDDTSLRIEGTGSRRWMEIAQAFAGPAGPGRPPGSGR